MKTLNIDIQDNILQKIKEKLFTGVVIIEAKNNNLEIVDINSTFEKMSGYSYKDLQNKSLMTLQNDDVQKLENKLISNCIESFSECKVILRNYKKDGTLFYNEMKLSPIFDNKQLVYYLAICNDVTSYIEEINYIGVKNKNDVEDIRKKDFKDFENFKMKSTSELMSNIAHQWRQPLNIVSMSASSLGIEKKMNTLDDEKFDLYVKSIIDSTNYLTEIINDFSATYKYYNQTYQNVNILDEVKRSIDICKPSLVNSKIDFIIDIDEKIDFYKKMNIGQLSKVIVNIVDNSKDAILLRKIQNPYVKISLKSINQKYIISVEDNAGGISGDILPNVFEPYSSTKHKYMGVGLSLNKCYRIVNELLKGELNAKNTEYGALLELSFSQEIDLKSIKLMYVEDNEKEREFFEKYLKRHIPNIMSFSNGLEALKDYKYTKDYDLIISDIRMPFLNGVDFIKNIRDENKKIPIIATSSFFDDDTLANINALGINTYYEKPTHIDEILKKIQEIINVQISKENA